MGGENFPEQEREKPLTREGYRALRYTDVRPDPACRPTGEKSGAQLRRLCPSAAGDGAGTRGGGADPPASGHGPGPDGGNGTAALRAGDAGTALPQGLTGESRELLRGAAREAKHLGSREITPQHLLLAMARRENSDAYELLKLNGISTDELFTHAVDYLHWEQGAPVEGRKRRRSQRNFWSSSVKICKVIT